MDGDNIEFLVKVLEWQIGTADNAGPSRNDGAYGSGAAGGDDNDDSKNDTFILSSDDKVKRRQRARKFNVGSDDDEEDDDSSTAVTVALPPSNLFPRILPLPFLKMMMIMLMMNMMMIMMIMMMPKTTSRITTVTVFPTKMMTILYRSLVSIHVSLAIFYKRGHFRLSLY